MSKNKTASIWEDKEVLFDLPFAYLKLRAGEKIFDRIEPIEDTKGNSGTKGRMVVTNLRIIWHSLSSPRVNISIGLNCLISTTTKIVNSGLRGTTQALYALATFKSNRYEFIFTNQLPNCIRHYTSVAGVHKKIFENKVLNPKIQKYSCQSVCILEPHHAETTAPMQLKLGSKICPRAYASSRLYRDIKLRGAIIHNKQLRILPLEKICLKEEGVWNLSSDSGNLGTLLVSNVRVVWYADVNEAFNVSMPYITIENISIRDSKFGEALVFVVRQSSGGYVLGFRADPRERLKPLLTELEVLHKAYNEKPIFGVELNWNNETAKPEVDDIEELEEIGEPRGEMGPNLYLASQLAQNKGDSEVQPVYSPYLGLAIEPLKEGFTLKSLFEVQTAN